MGVRLAVEIFYTFTIYYIYIHTHAPAHTYTHTHTHTHTRTHMHRDICSATMSVIHHFTHVAYIHAQACVYTTHTCRTYTYKSTNMHISTNMHACIQAFTHPFCYSVCDSPPRKSLHWRCNIVRGPARV
jgi:hypothetical protein